MNNILTFSGISVASAKSELEMELVSGLEVDSTQRSGILLDSWLNAETKLSPLSDSTIEPNKTFH